MHFADFFGLQNLHDLNLVIFLAESTMTFNTIKQPAAQKKILFSS